MPLSPRKTALQSHFCLLAQWITISKDVKEVYLVVTYSIIFTAHRDHWWYPIDSEKREMSCLLDHYLACVIGYSPVWWAETNSSEDIRESVSYPVSEQDHLTEAQSFYWRGGWLLSSLNPATLSLVSIINPSSKLPQRGLCHILEWLHTG